MSSGRVSISLLCTLVIAVGFWALAYLPSWLRTKEFSIELPATSEVGGQFPLDQKLSILRPSREISRGAPLSFRSLFSAHDSTPILVNFWATWCPPCIEEMPSLEYLERELNRQGKGARVRLVTISVDERPADVDALFKTFNFQPSFVVLHDKGGQLARSLGTTKFPETYAIDREGRILHKWVGPQNWLSGDIVRRIAALNSR